MKRQTALTLVVLGTLAGGAYAQSTVTVYGKLDIGFRKEIGNDNKQIATSGDSRLGFRGTEALGSGLQAFFDIQHRFFPNTGAQDGAQFWKGVAHVGLAGSFGRIGMGRQYIAAFSLVQNQVDPFEGDTVAQVRDVGMRVGGITKVRIDNSIRYDFSAKGVSFAASIAEASANGGPDRPYSVAASYRSGPLFLGAGYEDPAGVRDRQWNLAATYVLGNSTLAAGYARGRTNAGATASGYVLALNVPFGAGQFKAAYATRKAGSTTAAQKIGIGYHHSLSKRTLIYVDAGHDSKASIAKSGYDLGIRHSF